MQNRGPNLGDASKDLSELVLRDAHPMRVAMVEAMHWIDEPFSAGDFALMCAEPPSLGVAVYHMQVLVSAFSVMRIYAEEILKGAITRFYYFDGRIPAS